MPLNVTTLGHTKSDLQFAVKISFKKKYPSNLISQDANLELFPDPTYKLAKLERLHMSGPLGNAVTKYLLRGADAISSISLGIEWFDAAFCSTQPDGRSDYMGKEYLVRRKSLF